MMTQWFTLLAALCLTVMALGSGRAAHAGPGDSEAALQPQAWDQPLTETINEELQKASIPGAIIGVWQDGKTPYVRAFGVRDITTREPMTTDLHMRIGSNTKAFVVTAILQLVDQGKIGLDDPIDKYVSGVPSGTVITIRQLAGMRSGLYNFADGSFLAMIGSNPGRQWSPQELLDISFQHPLVFAPGTQFDYSNTNTVLLGLVVEKVSGQSLQAYLEEHILKPLGLTHTLLPTGAEMPSPHARGYTGPPWIPSGVVDATDWNPSWGWAAGAMISTLGDLQIWTRVLATGTLLKPETQRQRLEFLPAPGEGEGAEYGLGIENNHGWIGHNGNLAGYLTQPFYLPSQRMTMIILVNSNVNVLGFVSLTQAITKIISPNNLWPDPPRLGDDPR
jgi:D-alanyl-D-alanine carboxypeptidase